MTHADPCRKRPWDETAADRADPAPAGHRDHRAAGWEGEYRGKSQMMLGARRAERVADSAVDQACAAIQVSA